MTVSLHRIDLPQKRCVELSEDGKTFLSGRFVEDRNAV